MANYTIPEDIEDKLDNFLLGNLSSDVLSNLSRDEEEDNESDIETAPATYEEEDDSAATDETEEEDDSTEESKEEKEDSTENSTEDSTEESKEDNEESEDNNKNEDNEADAKKYTRGAEKRIGTLTKKFKNEQRENEKLKKEIQELRNELVKTLPEDMQKEYAERVQKQEISKKDYELATYQAREMFRQQVTGLNEQEIEIIKNVGSELLTDKPQSTYAIQTSNNGAKVLSYILQDPVKAQIFERLGDQGSLEFLHAMADEMSNNTNQKTLMDNIPNNVKPVGNGGTSKPKPKKIPKPLPKASGNQPSSSTDLLKMDNEQFYNEFLR